MDNERLIKAFNGIDQLSNQLDLPDRVRIAMMQAVLDQYKMEKMLDILEIPDTDVSEDEDEDED